MTHFNSIAVVSRHYDDIEMPVKWNPVTVSMVEPSSTGFELGTAIAHVTLNTTIIVAYRNP